MGIHADLASCLEALPIAYAKHRMLSDSRNQPRDFEIIQVNRTFEQVSGLPRSSIIGMKLKKLFQDMQEESQKVLELLTASAVAGSYASFEQFIASQQSWYEIHAYSDEPGYVHTLLYDITDRKMSYEALQRQHSKMALLLLQVSRAIAEQTHSGALTQVIVDGIAQLTEMKSAAIYLLKDHQLHLEATYPPLPKDFPAELRTAVLEDHPHIARALSGKKPVVIADSAQADLTPAEGEVVRMRSLRSILYMPLIYRDSCIGVLIPCSVGEVQPITDDMIDLTRILAGQAALSITEAHRAEQQQRYIREIEKKNLDLEEARFVIQENERRLSDILRFADTISFVTTDADKNTPRIIDFSPGAENMFGYRRDEVIGKPVEILHIRDDITQFPEVMKAMANRQQGFSGETVLVRKNGDQFPALFKSHPVFDDKNQFKGTVGVSLDITERKRAEEEKLNLQHQLAQSQKIEAVGQLAGGIAHDFNNMLSVILGYSQMLLEQLPEHDRSKEPLKEIHAAAQRSSGLTRQLLAFTKQQAVEPKILDINKTIDGLLNMLHRLIGEHIELQWIPDHDIGKLLIDPSQIDQVLVNLCINAREAIADTGRITIETTRRVLSESFFNGYLEGTPGTYVKLAVSDNGCGMDKETLSHIIEPFFTTKGPGKGTGLGLPTVYGIVKQNGGFMHIYSELEKGTTVHIYLPEAESIPEVQPAPKPKGAAPAIHAKILLVDDDDMVRSVSAAMLKQLGHQILPASSPRQAIELAEEHRDISLLMTDVVMPELNGKKLYELLKETIPNLQCLYMSGYTSHVVVHRGIADEGIGFLQKPFTKSDLAEKITDILA